MAVLHLQQRNSDGSKPAGCEEVAICSTGISDGDRNQEDAYSYLLTILASDFSVQVSKKQCMHEELHA